MPQTTNASLTIAEMREFASFTAAEQRYIRRSLDVGLGRCDAFKTWARDAAENAAIRRQYVAYQELKRLREDMPTDPRARPHRRLHRHADPRRRLRPVAGADRRLLRLPLSLRTPARRKCTALAAQRLRRRRRPAAYPPRTPPDAAAIAQRSRRNCAGWSDANRDSIPNMSRRRRLRTAALQNATRNGPSRIRPALVGKVLDHLREPSRHWAAFRSPSGSRSPTASQPHGVRICEADSKHGAR